MLSHKMDFNCCANKDGFRRDSHILRLLVDNSLCATKFSSNRNLFSSLSDQVL